VKASAHSQGSEALSLAEWRLGLAMSQNRRRAHVETFYISLEMNVKNHISVMVLLISAKFGMVTQNMSLKFVLK